MSDEFTTPGDDANTSGSSLRSALEAQIERNKKLEKDLADLKSAQTKLEIDEAWKGVPEQYRVAYKGDESPDKIREWWGQAAPLFGVADSAGQETAPVEETEEQVAEREAQQNFQAASSFGSDSHTTVQAALNKAQALRSPQNPSGRVLRADVDDVFKNLGIPPV